MKNVYKISIITNIPSPYRINLFKFINEKTEVKVLYTDLNEKGRRQWKVNFSSGYEYKMIKKINIFSLEMSFDIIKEIIQSNLIIIGGYGLPLMQQAIILCKLFKKKYILWTDGAILKEEIFIVRVLKKFLIGNATWYITTGIKGKEHLIHYGVNPKKISLIPLTGDTDILHENCIKFKESQNYLKLKNDLQLKRNVLITVAEIIEAKGIWELIKAFEILKKENNGISLLLIGDGKLMGKVKEYIKEKQLKDIVLTGFIQPNEIYKYYSLGTIFVLATHYDHWGLVINEAMSCQLPVITTNMACASYELVKDDYNGFIVNAMDVEAIVEKIKILLEDKKAVECGLNAYYTVKNINNISIAYKYIEIIDKVSRL